MSGKDLDKAPKELMLIDAEDGTDPYNSGIHKALGKKEVAFLRDGKTVRGDIDTMVEDEYRRRHNDPKYISNKEKS